MNYTISAPRYRDRAGQVHVLERVEENRYSDGKIEAVLQIGMEGENARIAHSWRSLCGEMEIQPVIEVVDAFACAEYIIPCVSVHGNLWGSGKEPKGLALDGKPWVFDGRRTSIPGCTLTENAERFCALIAANDSKASLTVSCSMEMLEDGKMAHRLLYPTIEEPLTYSNRDHYLPEYQTYVKLDGENTFAASARVVSGKPSREHFAMIDVQNAVQYYLKNIPAPKLSNEEMWSLSICFAEKLLYPYEGTELFIIGHSLTPEGIGLRKHFEFGWCGQNGMLARMMILDYQKTGNREHLDKALACLDVWAARIHPETGLPWVHYESKNKSGAISDTCNLSFYIIEMLRCYLTLKEMGIDKPAYRAAALSAADFLEKHRSDNFGLGKAWRVETGECVDEGGTIGAYPIRSFVECWNHTGEQRYLDAAEALMKLYTERDLLQFECTAGALDTHCIDKETSGALIMGGIALYEATKKQEYLDYAVLAAEYFCSWMYYFDVPCDADSDFARYDYHSVGGTSVSTQHHHIDPWGAFMVSYLEKIARYTGDEKWHERADALWFGSTQAICEQDGDFVHEGLLRSAGSQNEAYFHCRWGFSDKAMKPGTFNDWLVAWPAAFRMYTISEMARMSD